MGVSTRSVDPWDLVVKRIGDYLFIDKRDDGTFDFPRVRETATEPPNDDNGKTFINAPEPLSREAALVNQAYSQQVITDAKEPIRYENASPFVEEDANVPEVGYKYRHFSVEDEEAEHAHMDVVVRTQIDAYQLRGAQKKTVAVHAFHQYAVNNNDLTGATCWTRREVESWPLWSRTRPRAWRGSRPAHSWQTPTLSRSGLSPARTRRATWTTSFLAPRSTGPRPLPRRWDWRRKRSGPSPRGSLTRSCRSTKASTSSSRTPTRASCASTPSPRDRLTVQVPLMLKCKASD